VEGEEEKRRELAARRLLSPVCDFPDLFPANFPLLAGDERRAAAFPVSLAPSSRPDVSSAVLVRDPGFPTGARDADDIVDCIARPEEFVNVLSPFLFPFNETSKREKCSARLSHR